MWDLDQDDGREAAIVMTNSSVHTTLSILVLTMHSHTHMIAPACVAYL